MSAEEATGVGRITSGLRPNTLALKTIEFVYAQLPVWRDDHNRPTAESENKLNSQLSKFLELRARDEFPMVAFHHQEYQLGRSSVDISAVPSTPGTIGAGLYSIYDPILVLEGKRLPAPSSDREREYVTGGIKSKTGGIQRFKLGIHGTTLDNAAIVGYLQEGSASDWHEKINRWILDLCSGKADDSCVWKTSETLNGFEEDLDKGIAKCRSTHNRTGSAQTNGIALRHLWVTMHL